MREGEPVIGIRDSNPRWVSSIRGFLEGAGYQVVVPDQDTVDLLSKNILNLFFLGIGVETLNPQNVVADLRELTSTPFIVLGNIDTPSFKVSILDAGADDYLLKDGLDSRELLARVRAQLRRPKNFMDQPVEIVHSGDLTVDLIGKEVTVGGKSVSLFPTEFRLLSYLAQNLGRPILRRQILQQVWGSGYENSAVLGVYVQLLREKIEEDPKKPRYILNRRGFGYFMPNYNQPEIDFDSTTL